MTILRSGTTIQKYLFWVELLTEYNIYSIPCSCCKVKKVETCHGLKIRLEEHRKVVWQNEMEKLGMANHIWKEKGNIFHYGMKLE